MLIEWNRLHYASSTSFGKYVVENYDFTDFDVRKKKPQFSSAIVKSVLSKIVLENSVCFENICVRKNGRRNEI